MKVIILLVCIACSLQRHVLSELLRPSATASWRKWNAAAAVSFAWLAGGDGLLPSRASAAATAATAAATAATGEVALSIYSNERFGTSLKYPSGWEEKTGTLSGDRSVVAFTCPDDKDTSVSLVFSPVPADYNKLNSFGGKDNLRLYLLPSGDGISTKIVDEYVKGESYFLEYVVQADLPDASPVVTRHVASVFALRPQESVVGLTVQTKEDTYPTYKDVFSAVIPSLLVQ